MPGPLAQLHVVDFSRGIAGPHATRLLACYGADVLKVEAPAGDPSRTWGPFKNGIPHPETSAPFLFFDTNKRGVIADLSTDEGMAFARHLVRWADVLVEDFRPGELARLGLDLAGERTRRPALTVCSITPFGQAGPYAGMAATDIMLQAMGGAMHATGHAEREPLRLGGSYAEWQAGLAAALAITLAVYRAEATGQGDHIDLSIYETQAGGKDRRQLALLAHAYSGVVTRRHATAFAICSGVRPCLDGYINLLGNGPRLPAVLRMIGREDVLDRPEVFGPEELLPPELVDDIETSYLAWTMAHTMADALAVAQEHHILGGSVASIADVLADSGFRERGVWQTVTHPHAGQAEYPAHPFLMADSPALPVVPAPLLGEHTEAVRRALAEADRALPTAPRVDGGRRSPVIAGAPAAPDPRLPLAGIRVIDLSVVWAGPFAGQLLAEWGAEVIRMEPLTAVQPQTRGVERARHLTRELVQQAIAGGAMTAGYPHGDPLPDPWNRGAMFNSSSCNKLSFTGNIMAPDGRQAFERLVAVSDVIVENNVPSTAARMGVVYEELRRINPGIIIVQMPGFGLTGERANYRCWGNHLEGMAGHHIVRAYPDMTLDAAGETYACDSVAGLTAALAAVMALRHRARTGRGQHVEVPQIEAFLPMMAVEILDYGMNGVVAGPAGNDHRTNAPHGVYPCAGQDRWLALDVATDEQWQSLCRTLGAERLAADPRFASAERRWQQRRELDQEVSALTRTWNRTALFEALHAAAIPAGPVQDEADCFTCPHLEARGFFQELHRDDIGAFRYPGMLFRWQDTPNQHRRPPVLLGQDNAYVYRTLLQYTEEEYRHLLDKGEIGTAYPEWLLHPR